MPAANNTHKYTDYFRKMAVFHPDIAHDINTELQDGAIGTKKFARWNAEEAITGLRTQIGTPALLLELFEINSAAANVHDVRFRPTGAFTIIDQAIKGDFNDEERAYQVTERIAIDVLTKIHEHHYGPQAKRCETPFKEFRFNNLLITPVGPLFTNHFGWRVEFEFEFRETINVTSWTNGEDPFLADPAQWNADTW